MGGGHGSVSKGEDEIIVESRGKPKVAVISYDEFEAFQDLRKKQRRAAALTEFRALSERIGDRNKDLSEEQIDELANRFSHEFIEDLAREGKIRFERSLADYERGSNE